MTVPLWGGLLALVVAVAVWAWRSRRALKAALAERDAALRAIRIAQENRAPIERRADPPVPLAMDTAVTAIDDDQPLDVQVLDQLRSVLGPALEQALQPFFDDTPQRLEALRQAVSADDTGTAREAASAIRGSSSHLGATTLARLAKQALDLADDGFLARVEPMLPQLSQAFDAAAVALRSRTRRASGQREAEPPAMILVVDDDRSTCRALRFALQRSGFRVEEASDGQQALDALGRMTPDAILLDAVMPRLDGFAACAQIKQHPQWRTIPVLMITALDDPSAGKRCFDAGAGDYIAKPIDFAVLPQRVHGIIAAQRNERRTRRLAYNDSVTGLANRAMFVEQLTQRIEASRHSAQALAVLLIDIDRFDALTDPLGDRMLVAITERLRMAAPQADAMARLEGAQFAVALGIASTPVAMAAAMDIATGLSESFRAESREIALTAKIGIALYPEHATDASTLLKRAEVALENARRGVGSVCRFFHSGMEERLAARVLLEGDLPYAVERNQLLVHYQPQASLASGELVGVEALMRWQHPARGLLQPEEFLSQAQASGNIVAAGGWVLRAACTQARAWLDAGHPPLRVSVNVSVQQWLHRDFLSLVRGALSDAALSPASLELELSEATLMAAMQQSGEIVEQLHELGVRTCIDDFGTGHASLACLHRFAVDTIKLSREFIDGHGLSTRRGERDILRGIVAMARSLDVAVAVKGVETAAQLSGLRQRGCDSMQGHLIGEPQSAQDFERNQLSPSRFSLTRAAPEP